MLERLIIRGNTGALKLRNSSFAFACYCFTTGHMSVQALDAFTAGAAHGGERPAAPLIMRKGTEAVVFLPTLILCAVFYAQIRSKASFNRGFS